MTYQDVLREMSSRWDEYECVYIYIYECVYSKVIQRVDWSSTPFQRENVLCVRPMRSADVDQQAVHKWNHRVTTFKYHFTSIPKNNIGYRRISTEQKMRVNG